MTAIIPTDREFLDHAEKISGWLDTFTAARTVDLLNFQNSLGLRGPVYEVGVFWGKYFSVLLRGADQQGDCAYGFDLFQYNSLDQLVSAFDTTAQFISPTARQNHRFFAGNSADMSERDFNAILQAPARFVSIDGSHDHDEVLWDLTTAEKLLAPHGIIAADDFLNSTCIGTNEAINRFLMINPNVAPVAFCAGKLFIARPSWVERYKKELERSALADYESPKAKRLQDNIDNNTRHNIETQFHRRLTLMIP